jgi:hypothetical protein
MHKELMAALTFVLAAYEGNSETLKKIRVSKHENGKMKMV